MNTVSANPVAQLAKMYQLIEAALRGPHPLSLAELNDVPDIKATSKSPWQVRDIMRTLAKKGDYVTHQGEGRNMKYSWNKGAKPFLLPTKLAKKAAKAPSTVKVIKPEKPAPAPSKEIELVFDNTMIVIGRNAKTGRLRICIEEL